MPRHRENTAKNGAPRITAREVTENKDLTDVAMNRPHQKYREQKISDNHQFDPA